jgi:hypothetical protein
VKISNKILLGGFCTPIVIVLGFIVFMSINGTDEVQYQLENSQSMQWESGTEIYF